MFKYSLVWDLPFSMVNLPEDHTIKENYFPFTDI